jgi:D-glycero-D-manno-heptose 1,7-bisphosphate phosphatase
VFPSVARHGLLQGKAYGGFFLDIGTPPDFESAGAFMSHRLKRPALFFDRDGVLNDDSGYTHRPADFRWTVGAREAVKLVNDSGWLAFVVTNQAGVARGLYTESAVNSLHTWMNKNLRQTGAHIDDFRYCPHHPDGAVPEYAKACHCRKPEPGMLLDLMVTWPVDRPRSVLIGNSTSDIAAASAAGIESRYYASGSLLDMVRSELARRGAVQDGELTGA